MSRLLPLPARARRLCTFALFVVALGGSCHPLSAQLINVSTRGAVSTGDALMIGGFVVNGPDPKQVLIRAAGPALVQFGLADTLLADPSITVFRDSTQVGQNDDWQDGGQGPTIEAAFTRLGAFEFAAGSKDAALLLTLEPGSYTVHARGVGNTTGVVLLEAYDADPDPASAATRLTNISTRLNVGGGNDALIAGFVVGGSISRRFLIRASGPGLAPFLSGTLANPSLTVRRGDTVVNENDDWDAAGAATNVDSASIEVGAFSFDPNSGDAAMVVTLPPGAYTAQVNSVGGGAGIALVEVYEIEQPELTMTLIGLGDTIRVSRSADAVFGGLADSPVGIAGVTFQNLTTSMAGTATGTKDWTATIPLTEGDNRLRFTAKSHRGKSVQLETTVTFNAAADFLTPLQASSDVVLLEMDNELTFTLGIGVSLADGTVTLHRTDENGAILGEPGAAMADNGVLPDEIQGDGIFTTQLEVTASEAGSLYYRVQVTPNGEGGPVNSETIELVVTNPVAQEEMDRVEATAQAAQAELDLVSDPARLDEAATQAANTLLESEEVAAAGSVAGGGVWFVTSDGLLGLVHTTKADQRATVRGRATSPIALAPSQRTTPKVRYYSPSEAAWRDFGTPIPPASRTKSNAERQGILADGDDDHIQSKRALIVSPFINNPSYASGNFGNTDDFFAVWQTISNNTSGRLTANSAVVNNGSVQVSLDTFRDLEPYGYIHLCTHGDNYYEGLFSAWNPVWGPNNWLLSSLSQVVVLTGLQVAKDGTGKWVLPADIQAELRRHRIALTTGGSVALLPGFFRFHLGNLPNSLVAIASCRSTINASMSNAFLARNAGAVVGFTDYVASNYAQGTTNRIMMEMLADKTVGQGFAAAVGQYGASDADSDPAALTLFGTQELKLAPAGLQNGGLEQAELGAWEKEGDGRVITRLGMTNPTEGTYMAIISTGLGYTTASGSIEQDFTVEDDAESLVFDWNFFSEEWLEYIGSIYQDSFQVTITELDAQGAEINGTTQEVLLETIDSLGGSVTVADVSFDIGGVYRTGWRETTFSLVPLRGKFVRLRFAAQDVGDSIYDSAILIDNVRSVSP